jgi:hypothetical protein
MYTHLHEVELAVGLAVPVDLALDTVDALDVVDALEVADDLAVLTEDALALDATALAVDLANDEGWPMRTAPADEGPALLPPTLRAEVGVAVDEADGSDALALDDVAEAEAPPETLSLRAVELLVTPVMLPLTPSLPTHAARTSAIVLLGKVLPPA